MADGIFPGTMIFMAANRTIAVVFAAERELSEVSIHHASSAPIIRKCAMITITTMQCISAPVYNDKLAESIGLSA